jgi:hypothetical protein
MRNLEKTTKRMLMNCYGNETYEMCKGISRKSILKWLEEANLFFVKVLGIKRILENEKKMKEMGW